jgi:hypothetical protein
MLTLPIFKPNPDVSSLSKSGLTLIKSLHENAKSLVKWNGNISEPLNVNQGVRQGGILSTDLYKLYINPHPVGLCFES